MKIKFAKKKSKKRENEFVNLDKCIEVFSSIPKYGRKRIFGVENEYGVINPKFNKLPPLKFIDNGGKIYLDCKHIEYASPETSNPLEVVVFEKAGELLSQPFAGKLYKNNVAINEDYSGGNLITFGAHENYFTKASFSTLKDIIPFLVTRQIFAGSGKLNEDGSFEISQKSSFIRYAISGGTTNDRGILCTKDEKLSDVDGWHRLHLILGDANMSEVADFLKLGTTGLILDLAEDKHLPSIHYGIRNAVPDLHNISKLTKNWTLRNVDDKIHSKATTIQRKYLSAAKKAYQGRDEITDYLLFCWEDTLNKLDEDPMSLVGTLDWVTKKALIDSFAAKHDLKKIDPVLRNIDLQYHDLDRITGLFYTLQEQGKIERLITDELITKAKTNPPKDTRAFLRGTLIKRSKENRGSLCIDWDYIFVETRGLRLKKDLNDPFKFTKNYFDTTFDLEFAELNYNINKFENVLNSIPGLIKYLRKNINDIYDSSLRKLEKIIPLRLEHKKISSKQEILDYIDNLNEMLLYPDTNKIIEKFLPLNCKAIVIKNLGPRKGKGKNNYYYGGSIDVFPLKRIVTVLQRTHTEVGAAYFGRKWNFHPDELKIEEPKEFIVFKRKFARACDKKKFFEKYVSQIREEVIEELKPVNKAYNMIKEIYNNPRAANLAKKIGANRCFQRNTGKLVDIFFEIYYDNTKKTKKKEEPQFVVQESHYDLSRLVSKFFSKEKTNRTPFTIQYHHRYDLRDWLVQNFPFIENSSLNYGKQEAKLVKKRASEIVDASRQVEEIDLRVKSAYVHYYNEDWVRIKSAYEKKDYVEMARALRTLKDAIDVE